MRAPALVLVLAPVVLLSGCDKKINIPKDLKPAAAFQQMKVKQIDFDGAKTVFIFEVKNPYPLGLNLAELSWNLGVADSPLLDGTNKKGLKIEAGATSEVKIPVSVAFKDIFAVAANAKGSGEVPWTLDGKFAFDTPIGAVGLPFSEQGVMPALTAPKIKLAKLRLGKLDLASQTAQLFVDIDIESEQEKPLGFKAFKYDLKLGGDVVANGATSFAPIEGGKGTVTIPLSLKLVDLGAQVVSAIKDKDDIRVGIDTDAEVDTPFGVVPLKVSKSKLLELQ